MKTKLFEGKYASSVERYVYGCIDGSIPANEYRIKACQRMITDLESDTYDFNARDADFVISIIEGTICHQQGEDKNGNPLRGTPFFLMDFHKFIIYNLMGFKKKGTNINRFKEALIFIPRKNVKTSFSAALAYAVGLLFRKSGSKIYVVAASLKQTFETFGFLNYNVKNMGEWDEDGGMFHVINNNNEHSIKAEQGGWLFELNALASNPDVQDSFNGNIAICDEVHAFKKAKQYTLFKDMMKTYTNKLLIGISTAGDNPSSFLAQRVKYAKRVLDKAFPDEQLFIFICEADMTVSADGKMILDYTDKLTQEKANPAYGESIKPEELMEDALSAQNDPQLRKDYFAKSLNVFTNQIDTYFDVVQVVTSDSKYTYTLEELAKLPIKWYGGADLSKLHDLSGVALYGRYNGIDICITHGFMPVTAATEKADQDSIPVFWWRDEGWLTLCNSSIIEYEDVVQWFLKMKKLGFKIVLIGYDRRYAREFVLKMKKAGFKMRDQMQRYVEKTEAFREIEKKIITQSFYFLGNKAFEYCISNVKAIEDSDDFVRYQKVMPNQRIDLFDAGVIACKQYLIANERGQNAGTFID